MLGGSGFRKRLARAVFLGFASLGLPQSVHAQTVSAEEFYKGKVMTFFVGSGEGGSFGIYGQVLAQHMSRHLPGQPRIIVRYFGGQSGGLTLANQMQGNVTPDGLTFAMTQQTIVPAQLINPQFAQYDARTWIWIGNMAPIRNMLAVYHTAKAQSVEEAKVHEVIVGATGPSSPTYILPDLLNKFAGTKFKIVTGYKGTADLNLAMIRGEIEGRGGSWLSIEQAAPDMIHNKQIRPIAFASMTRDPSNPDTPTLPELVNDPMHKQVAEFVSSESEFGRSLFLPPNVPADRVELLRNAFTATMKDEAFLADAKRAQMPIEPMSHEKMAEITKRVLSTPPHIVELAK
jgi:tripartite-type tricarboxylate transporter receptor subunit TctC